MDLKFIPLDYDYKTIENKTYMLVYGKTSEGKSCCIMDEAISFFYVLSKNPEKLLKKTGKIKDIEKVEIVEKRYLEKPVKAIKVFCPYNEITDIAHKIKKLDSGAETRERDISLVTRYIIEKKFKPLVWYNVKGDILTDTEIRGISNLDTDLALKIEEIKESKEQEEFKPKVLAFDIEAEEFEIGRGEILMISLVSDEIKKVLTWKKCGEKQKYVEYFKDEAEMIEKFAEYIKEIKPDIITGYFSDGFDLPYLRARAEKNHIDLKLGKDGSRILFSRGRPLNAKIKGIVHIDLLKFIETAYSQYLQSETLSLNEVAGELLGERKLDIDHNIKAGDRKEHDWKKYFRYNLQDSILTFKLFQKIWPDLLEFTRVIQEPLYNTSRYALSGLVENYILHNLNRFNEIAEKRPTYEEIQERKMRPKAEGAFVLQPEAGLYEDIAIFDFTSMHTTIIVSFNISKSTLLKRKEKNSYESPELKLGNKKTHFYFSKKPGFFPLLAKEIVDLRKKYKEEYKKNPTPITKARSNAFKLLSASIHGYIGFFGARYYSLEASSAILAFVRKLNKETIDKTKRAGYGVIYADTDSVAFTLNKKTKSQVLSFLKKLNKELPGIMELELEDFYKRGIWVTKRTGDFGAKKKYALIDYKGKLKIRGFETVRRDWCLLSREVQNKVLKKILEDGNEISALKYVKSIIKKIKKREIDRKQLIIRTQLKKPISEYRAEGPHVTIAKKMLKAGMPVDAGMLISYYIAESKEKKALVRERAKLPDEEGRYDIDYYLKHQILPAIENIFEVFNINTKDLVEETKQKKLDSF
jgi:DNA polymerase elongation subunit (family B)